MLVLARSARHTGIIVHPSALGQGPSFTRNRLQEFSHGHAKGPGR